jgi:F420-0:gamma-glutamyl ligase
VAAAAELVMGQRSERVPAVIVRGLTQMRRNEIGFVQEIAVLNMFGLR